MTGIVSDITQRKRNEAARRESEAHFRTMANSAPVLIWIAGTDKLCTYFNQRWLEFTGRTLEQECGNGWTKGIHPDDLAGCLKSYAEAADARRPFVLEYRLRRCDGEYRWLSDHGVPRYNDEGQFLGYIGSCVDITNHKQAEQELATIQERMTLTADAANLGMWVWDIPKDRIWATEKCKTLYGHPPQGEMTYEALFVRVHPEDRAATEHAIARMLAGKGGFDQEHRVLLPDGTTRWVAASGRAEHDAGGKAVRLLGISIDITQRKQAELEIQAQRQELIHFSRVTMLGELSGSLAHELLQPIGAILRNAEAAEFFLQGPSPDLEEVRAIVVDIRKDDERAGAVINRMRGLLKRREVEYTVLDLNQLTAEVISLIRPDAEARKVRLEIESGSSVPLARGDRVQLQQVLLNLLVNAMDAVNDSVPESRRVIVRLRYAGPHIEVAVSDTGQGIPADRFPRLFEPFFTTKSTGMGIGLGISRRIVEAHGGRIWAENSPAGATFKFTVPLAKEEQGSGFRVQDSGGKK